MSSGEAAVVKRAAWVATQACEPCGLAPPAEISIQAGIIAQQFGAHFNKLQPTHIVGSQLAELRTLAARDFRLVNDVSAIRDCL